MYWAIKKANLIIMLRNRTNLRDNEIKRLRNWVIERQEFLIGALIKCNSFITTKT